MLPPCLLVNKIRDGKERAPLSPGWWTCTLSRLVGIFIAPQWLFHYFLLLLLNRAVSKAFLHGCHCSVAQLCRLFVIPRTAARRLSSSSLYLGACSNSCPLSQWCHPTISSSFCMGPARIHHHKPHPSTPSWRAFFCWFGETQPSLSFGLVSLKYASWSFQTWTIYLLLWLPWMIACTHTRR